MRIEYDKEWCMRMAQVERLQEALDAAVAAERERLLSAAEETKWAMYSGEKTFADALREIMGPNVEVSSRDGT